jgi:hypothetical protein
MCGADSDGCKFFFNLSRVHHPGRRDLPHGFAESRSDGWKLARGAGITDGHAAVGFGLEPPKLRLELLELGLELKRSWLELTRLYPVESRFKVELKPFKAEPRCFKPARKQFRLEPTGNHPEPCFRALEPFQFNLEPD